MATWTAITNAEVTAGKPAYASVALRQRDNMTALAEGDATVPEASKLTAGSFKQPTAATQTAVLADQAVNQTCGDDNGTQVFFQAIVIVPGVYTMAGVMSDGIDGEAKIYVNDVLDYTSTTASFSHEMTLASGDIVRADISSSDGITLTTFSDFQLLSEIYVPLAHCQFYYFTGSVSGV